MTVRLSESQQCRVFRQSLMSVQRVCKSLVKERLGRLPRICAEVELEGVQNSLCAMRFNGTVRRNFCGDCNDDLVAVLLNGKWASNLGFLLSQFGRQRSVRVPLEGQNTLIGGPNGSGKTTFLDAIRLCLGSERLSHPKTLHKEYLRPDGAYHVVGLVAYNRTGGKLGIFAKINLKAELVTLARVWMPKGDGYESSFVIMPGEPDVEAIIRTAESTSDDCYTPDKYRETIAMLGITSDVLEHLIVRQSRVTDVTNISGRELYQTVLGAAGSKETSQRYALARKIAGKEYEKLLERQRDEVENRRQLHEKSVLRDKQRTFDSKTQEIANFRAEKDARTAHDTQRDLKSHLDALTTAEEDSGPLAVKVEATQADLDLARQRLEALRNPPDAAQRAALQGRYDAAQAEHELVVAKVARLSQAKDRLKSAPADNRAEVELRLQAARDSWAAATAMQAQAARLLQDLNAEADRYRAGDPFPPEVRATVDQLAARGVKARVLAESITLPKGQEAAFEHALGNLRYTLVVPEGKLEDTLVIARGNNYPGPVTDNAGSSRKGAIRSSAGPEWLQEYEASGANVQDRHGTWVGTTSNLVTGKDAAKVALKEVGARIKEAQGALGRASAECNLREGDMKRLDDLWRRCLQRDEDLVAVKDLDALTAQDQGLHGSLRDPRPIVAARRSIRPRPTRRRRSQARQRAATRPEDAAGTVDRHVGDHQGTHRPHRRPATQAGGRNGRRDPGMAHQAPGRGRPRHAGQPRRPHSRPAIRPQGSRRRARP